MDLLRSLPIGLYLEQPQTWLHSLDPRVKLAWLLGFLLTPIAANVYWRLGLVLLLVLLTLICQIPWRVWRRQMGLVLLFSFLLFFITLFAPDGLDIRYQPRFPSNPIPLASTPPETPNIDQAAPQPSEATDSPAPAAIATTSALPQPTSYRYVLFHRGIFKVTRRSLELAIRVATLTFTLLYSANLYLLTTAPEEITASLETGLRPLKRFSFPVAEVILTLTLALRFIPLVLEEIQNLIRAVRTRAINWKKLGVRGSVEVWLTLGERMLENLLFRAKQIAGAMQVRGFTTAEQHQVRWYQFQFRWHDRLFLFLFVCFLVSRFVVGAN